VRAFQAGGVDFITKPFQFEELKVRIETHLRLRRLRDELAMKNRELQRGYDRLRELETLRDNLTHMIVHDMRQPLTGLYGYLQLLRIRTRDADLADMSGYVDRSMESANALIGMVNSLLEIHRMESGTLVLQKTPCDIAALADRAWERMEPLRGTRLLEKRYPAELLTVSCDEGIVVRVLQNILGNALGFAPEGSTIAVEIEGPGNLAVVRVSDGGPGIAPEHHARIFEKFGHVETAGATRAHSTGLGLAFCKLAVEAHGGSIGVESDLGKGSTFWFMLPRA
jgi:two-component system sensor histidine kinase/response regulator